MSDASVWKHIGLHGHSVGTFAAHEDGIQWKSALYGQDEAASSTRKIPKDSIAAAQWSVFGKSGHIRIKTSGDKLHHEMRFDGFQVNDYDSLKNWFKDQFDVDLVKHSMSAAGTQYGISKMTGKKLTFRHCILDEADEEGEVSITAFFLPKKVASLCETHLYPSIISRSLKCERVMK